MMPEKFHGVIARIFDREHFLRYLGKKYRRWETNIEIAYSQFMLDSMTKQRYYLRFQTHFNNNS